MEGKRRCYKTAEEKFISTHAELMTSVGIRIAGRIVQLVEHFLLAPVAQIVGYVLTILQEDMAVLKNKRLLIGLVSLKNCLSKKTDHDIAIEIANNNLAVPSYCLSYEGNNCKTCGSELQW